MPARTIREIPNGSDIFIDANILIYALAGQSVECRDLLIRCSPEEVIGVCLFETVNEATHKFMLAEAQSKGLISGGSARELRAKPEVVKRLAKY